MTSPDTCPTCGEALVPVIVGYPNQEDFEAAERGEIVLWGCLVDGEIPALACPWAGDGHS